MVDLLEKAAMLHEMKTDVKRALGIADDTLKVVRELMPIAEQGVEVMKSIVEMKEIMSRGVSAMEAANGTATRALPLAEKAIAKADDLETIVTGLLEK